jgi:hypothetical protein
MVNSKAAELTDASVLKEAKRALCLSSSFNKEDFRSALDVTSPMSNIKEIAVR